MKNDLFEKKVKITRYKKVDFIPDGSTEPYKACQIFYNISVESDNEVGLKEVKVIAPVELYDKLKGRPLPILASVSFELEDLSPNGRPNILDVKPLG